MTTFYDKDGSPLELLVWAEKYEDAAYRRVAWELTKDERYMVSTIWEGLCSPITMSEQGPCGIFETAVFKGDEEVGKYRWDTLAEAMAGHDMAVHRFGGEDE